MNYSVTALVWSSYLVGEFVNVFYERRRSAAELKKGEKRP